ncbi:polyamine ABC transporter substrate-binding protein [Ruegeria atlantica]|uniref:polyamine ABC transporter substrate-binding protein n=1 Tax=Ruegeria atlantica TaxID=81569 RepID=UPI00147EAB3F|nr:polyamine ABC transporter substrate-binding protein [Ruegeria atlantica]
MKSILTAASMTLLFTTALYAEEKVYVYNWADYIDESLLQKFTTETGVEVVYDNFDSNDLLETKMLAGKSGYDVVFPSGTFLQRQIEAGVFQPLDKVQLPNSVNLWDAIEQRTATFDPENSYSVNYMWGSTGIAVNVEKVREALGDDIPLDSMELLFNPEYVSKLSDCGVNFLDAPSELIPAALTYIGEDPNTRDLDVIAKAEPVLNAVRPYVRKFNSTGYISDLATGEVCVSMAWSGDGLQARSRAAESGNGIVIEYSAFREGSGMWFDQIAIPADAPHPELAHKFINFLMEPENAAAISNYVWYANGNLASQEFLNEAILNDPGLYPSEEGMKNLYMKMPWDAEMQRFVTRMWTRVKSGV